MALEVQYMTALAVEHADSEGILPTTASAILYRPDGSTLQTPVVTLPTVATTTAAGTTATALVVADVTGFKVGRRYRVVSGGVTQVFVLARVNTTAKTLYPLSALAVAPDTTSPVVDITMSLTLAAPAATAEIQNNLRLELTYDDGTTAGHAQWGETVHVVRWKWSTPITAQQVRDHVSTTFPSMVRQRTEEYWGEIAERSNNRIRRTVDATGRRANLYGSPDSFEQAGICAARWQLAQDGLYPPTVNPGLYQAQLEAEFNREMTTVLSSLAQYDADGDGKTDEKEQRGLFFSIATTR